MKQKLEALITNLNQGLVERDQTIKLALLTLLAGENILLVGPPGTGKSLIARRMASGLASKGEPTNDYFEYLLTKFSTPEEIFGPLSISELKQDRFKRNTQGYLPTVTTAFLDEIFKSSSSILNALLTILNERIYHNGAETQEVPLRSLIAASNELPTEQAELSALYDRFLVRVFIDYVQDASRKQFFKPAETFQIKPELCITATELEQIASAAAKVEIPELIANAILNIWAEHKEVFKEDRREELSDRRLTKVIQLLRISAVTNGRDKVDLSDVFLLKDCLWNNQDNAKQVMAIISKELQKVSANWVDESIDEPEEQENYINEPKEAVVIKGYEGGGTEFNPFLIQSVEDLAELARPEVGQQGYYFKQTADIDISNIATWPSIVFIGNYNGDNHLISGKGRDQKIFIDINGSILFNVNLEGLSLSVDGKNSTVNKCKTNRFIFINSKPVDDCIISNCESGKGLVKKGVVNCKIINCIAKFFLAGSIDSSEINSCKTNGFISFGAINKSTINNSLVAFDIDESSLKKASVSEENGLITNDVFENSTIENSYIYTVGTDVFYHNRTISCIAKTIKSSKVINNFIGRVLFIKIRSSKSRTAFSSLGAGFGSSSQEAIAFVGKNIDLSSELTSNYITDLNSSVDKKHSEIISEELLTQRHFENTMGWDFDNIWIWDKKEKRPNLRQIGVNSESIPNDQKTKSKQKADVLAKQLQTNIWL